MRPLRLKNQRSIDKQTPTLESVQEKQSEKSISARSQSPKSTLSEQFVVSDHISHSSRFSCHDKTDEQPEAQQNDNAAGDETSSEVDPTKI